MIFVLEKRKKFDFSMLLTNEIQQMFLYLLLLISVIQSTHHFPFLELKTPKVSDPPLLQREPVVGPSQVVTRAGIHVRLLQRFEF